MPWGRIDDTLYDHPKFQNVSAAAIGLWTLVNSYSNRHLLDGYVTHHQVKRLARAWDLDDATIQELLNNDLWESTGSGIHVHDYLEYNKSAAQITQERADNARRQDEWRRRNLVQPALADTISNGVTNDPNNGVSNDPYPVPGTRYPVTQIPGNPVPPQPLPNVTQPARAATSTGEMTSVRVPDSSPESLNEQKLRARVNDHLAKIKSKDPIEQRKRQREEVLAAARAYMAQGGGQDGPGH